MIKKIVQYDPLGRPEKKWHLSVEDDVVEHHAVFSLDGQLESVGRWGKPIPASFFDEPPERDLDEIRALYGEIKEYKFSYDSYPNRWGWLVSTSDEDFLIGPAGWYEVTVRIEDVDDSITLGGERGRTVRGGVADWR